MATYVISHHKPRTPNWQKSRITIEEFYYRLGWLIFGSYILHREKNGDRKQSFSVAISEMEDGHFHFEIDGEVWF